MAKLSVLNAFPDELPSSDPPIGSGSDENNERGDNPEGEEPWDPFLGPLDDNLFSRSQSESKDSQQELVSTQLILETTAAFELSHSPQQAAELVNAAEFSNLLNSSRAIGTSTPPTRTSHRLPIRVSEASAAPTASTGKLRPVARPDSSSQSSGKLRKPTKGPENLTQYQKQRKDQFKLLSSAQSTTHQPNTSQGNGNGKGAARRSNVARNRTPDLDRDELQVSASPMVRRVSKSIEQFDLEMGSSPPSSSHQQKGSRLSEGKGTAEPGTIERRKSVEVVVRHKKRKSNEDLEEVEVGERQPTKRGRPPRLAKTQEPAKAPNGVKSNTKQGLATAASSNPPNHPTKRGRPRITDHNTRSADRVKDVQYDDKKVEKPSPAKRGKLRASQKSEAPVTSSRETRSTRNSAGQGTKSNKAVLAVEGRAQAGNRARERKGLEKQAQPQATSSALASRRGAREQQIQDMDNKEETEAESDALVEESTTGGHQQPSNDTARQVGRGPRRAQGQKDKASGDPKTKSSHSTKRANRKVSNHAVEDEQEGEGEDENYSEETVVQDDGVGLPSSDEDPGHELYGQMPALRKVVKTINELNRKHPFATNTGHKISHECRETRKLFELAMTGDDPRNDKLGNPEEPLGFALGNIREMINDLKLNSNKEAKIELVQDIYAHTFPSLGHLLIQIIEYHATKAPEFSDDDEYALDTDSLTTVLAFVHLILSLEDSVKRWPEKPDTSLAIVRPIRRNFIAPLRTLAKVFNAELHSQRNAAAEKEAREILREELELREKQEARRREATARDAARKKQWHVLHVVRMCCEPDIHRHDHLWMKSQIDDQVDLDANGVRFERVTVFKDRDGSRRPEQGGGTPLEGPEWTDEQCLALLDGLRDYQGPQVFEKIFRKYCRPGGILRRYNVEEITQQAAYLRKMAIKADEASREETEQWILDIPVLQ